MSRWLQNVGQFLEKLDDQAERVVEERALDDDDDDEGDQPRREGKEAFENILAARGLSGSLHQEDFPDFDDDDDADAAAVEEQQHVDFVESPSEVIEPAQEPMKKSESEPAQPLSKSVTEPQASDSKDESPSLEPPVEPDQNFAKEADERVATSNLESSPVAPPQPPKEITHALMANDALAVVDNSMENGELDGFATPAFKADPPPPQQATPFFTPARSPAAQPKSAPPPPKPNTPSRALDNAQATEKIESSAATARQAQKETRTLRRHVVTLNKQLETAEAEMQAQRTELERAAERMEKDRVRHRQEREKEKTRHADELKIAKAQQEQALKDMRVRTDQQVEDVRRQLRDLQDQRTQEGGDWNKELLGTVQREQEMAVKMALMDDEKTTDLSQIATLQAQQEALGNRLESLTHTADNAMEREREAEDRLDAALTLHARQISQRQSRETELERTVSELGAALVAARNKQSSGLTDAQSAGDETSQNRSLGIRVQTLEQELENLHAQFSHEKQRNETLKHELQDVSREYTEEASAIHSRQVMHDRYVGDLTQTISKLKGQLREGDSRKESMARDSGSEDNEDLRQIKNLSEEVLRQREKASSSSSEISALKSRLKVALDRAAKSEEVAEKARSGEGDLVDVERGPNSGNGMRRRGKKSPGSYAASSMRSALHLDVIRGEGSERVGKSLDALDKFLVESGKFLRHNPVARLLFIVYLLMLHLWTFLLLFVHAHNFENLHGDFGAGGNQAHGPHALMEQQPPPMPTELSPTQ